MIRVVKVFLCLHLFISIIFICYYSVNVFHMDDWGTPGNIFFGYLSSNNHYFDLWSQHNESRLFIFKVFCLLLLDLNLYQPIIFVFIKILLLLYLVFFITNIYPNKKSKILLSLILLNICFLPSQSYSLICGITWLNVLVPVFLIIGINIHFSNKYNRNTKSLLKIFICIISTLTYANGMILWFFLNPLLFNIFTEKKYRYNKLNTFLFNIISLSTIYFYFIDYYKPLNHPSIIDGLLDIPRTFHFFTILICAPFIISNKTFHLTPILFSLLFCCLLFYSRNAIKSLFRKVKLNKFEFSVLLLILYGLSTCIVVSLGRSKFGLSTAIQMPHYPGIPVFFHLGLFSFLYYLNDYYFLKFRNYMTFFLIVTSIINLQYSHELFVKYNNQLKISQLAIKYIEYIPQNPFLLYSNPEPSIDILPKYQVFKKNNLLKSIDINNYEFLNLDKTFGKLNFRNNDKTLFYNGYVNSNINYSYDHIIVTSKPFDLNSLFCTLTFNSNNNLFTKIFGNNYSHKFDHFVDYNTNTNTFYGYAVDINNKKLLPLESFKYD